MADRVLILGAGSDIALAVARRYAGENASLCLVGRSEAALERIQADLLGRGAGEVVLQTWDLAEVDGGQLAAWREALGGLDVMLLAYAMMPGQEEVARDAELQAALLNTNFVSAAGWLQLVARHMADSGGGTIGVIGSVAGDRARKPNYIYGSSKSALAFYAEGLALTLADSGVAITLIKPGQTRTRLTQHMDSSGPLWADADEVGAQIHRALGRKKRLVYAPSRWRWIMLVIRAIPHAVFRRLNF